MFIRIKQILFIYSDQKVAVVHVHPIFGLAHAQELVLGHQHDLHPHEIDNRETVAVTAVAGVVVHPVGLQLETETANVKGNATVKESLQQAAVAKVVKKLPLNGNVNAQLLHLVFCKYIYLPEKYNNNNNTAKVCLLVVDSEFIDL